jgi:hypothetical protein
MYVVMSTYNIHKHIIWSVTEEFSFRRKIVNMLYVNLN